MGEKLSLHSGTMVNTALIKGIKMLLNEKFRVEPGWLTKELTKIKIKSGSNILKSF